MKIIPDGTMNDIAKKFAMQIEADLFATIAGSSTKRRQTALIRWRGGSFETVELDDAGNVPEPTPRCCYGTVLHSPNCKFWMTCT